MNLRWQWVTVNGGIWSDWRGFECQGEASRLLTEQHLVLEPTDRCSAGCLIFTAALCNRWYLPLSFTDEETQRSSGDLPKVTHQESGGAAIRTQCVRPQGPPGSRGLTTRPYCLLL